MTDDFEQRISNAYAAKGQTVVLGKAVKNGQVCTGATVQIPTSMCNRHGLIAGATGTGKTKTLQVFAEQLSAKGVPVFVADMKGDLTGLARPGVENDKISARSQELQMPWSPQAMPVEFLSLGGIGAGVPVRATISSFGPHLLAKVLGANKTQTSSLALVFHYADQAGLPLLDLVDLQEVLKFLDSEDGKKELAAIGGLSSSTVGVLLRSLSELAQQGADAFFGETEFVISDLLRVTSDGKGIISSLELNAVQDKPKLFSTFLMWLLAELFEQLPEVGDLDKPKLVFFFDEAHLLFDGASKAFIDQVAQTVRLIRSKGVGVFFVTQLPDDVPEEVLAQLGNRVQHALRAFTPRDAKALKAAVTTYPKTKDYDLEEDLTALGTGEAMITILSEKGAPTPVVWTRMQAPQSCMTAIDAADVIASTAASPLLQKYKDEIDRESAREMLAKKMQVESPGENNTVAPPQGTEKKQENFRSGKSEPNVVTSFLKSREGRQVVNSVVRGVFGLLKKR